MGVIVGAAKGRICQVPLGSLRGLNARAEKNQRTIKVAGAPGGGGKSGIFGSLPRFVPDNGRDQRLMRFY